MSIMLAPACALLLFSYLLAQNLTVTVQDSVTSALLEGAEVSLHCAGELRASGVTDAASTAGLTLPVSREETILPPTGEVRSGPFPNPAAPAPVPELIPEAGDEEGSVH